MGEVHRKSLSLRIEGLKLFCLDQTQLPHKEVWLDASEPQEMIEIIKALKVRGAPLIGVAAGMCLGVFCETKSPSQKDFMSVAIALREARPTAVNLMIAIDRLIGVFENDPKKVYQEAVSIFDEDVELCEKIAKNGQKVIESNDQILTHCNTGGLATVGLGTALGVIVKAHEEKKNIHVYVDETRPLLQGARLNTWELKKAKVPYTLICDNMAGFLMAQGKVNKVIVGADRIATNGDFANKVGTYSLAVLCNYHRVPFYVAAPITTLDKECHSGKDIPIEERNPEEVIRDWAPGDSKVWNPAFDVVPAHLVSGWILDTGLFDFNDVENGALK